MCSSKEQCLFFLTAMPGARIPERETPSPFDEVIALDQQQQQQDHTSYVTWTALDDHSHRLTVGVRKTVAAPWRTWTSDFIKGSITHEQLQGIIHGWMNEAAEQGLFEG